MTIVEKLRGNYKKRKETIAKGMNAYYKLHANFIRYVYVNVQILHKLRLICLNINPNVFGAYCVKIEILMLVFLRRRSLRTMSNYIIIHLIR
jgi:hypothetical protein